MFRITKKKPLKYEVITNNKKMKFKNKELKTKNKDFKAQN